MQISNQILKYQFKYSVKTVSRKFNFRLDQHEERENAILFVRRILEAESYSLGEKSRT